MISSSSRKVSCLGFISPRSATLLLAVFGFLAHVQQFNYLTVLHDTFPHVPNVRSPSSTSTHLGSCDNVGVESSSSSSSTSSCSIGFSDVVLDSEVSSSSSGPGINLFGNENGTRSSMWKEAATKPVRWFNLLPSKFQQIDGKGATINLPLAGNAYMEEDWKARQRDQEEDRKSWEAARTLTKVVRIYALLCAITCLCGVLGVIRSSLFCTRIFVLSSSLDLFMCALSLVSLGIIVTYPNIRGLICEELSNSSAVIMDLDRSSGQDLRSSSGPVLLLGRAATSFWKRATSETPDQSSESLPAGYWWDSLLDNLLENENCDDVLESVLLPLGLVISLVYLALRIHFLVVIRNYYISLLRDQMSYHLSSQTGGERKYSFSSTSSDNCLPSSSKKCINEKMA